MANLIFPSELTRTVLGVGSVGTPLTSVAGQTATVYTDAGGTTAAMIYSHPDNVLIVASQVTVDSNGRLPFFHGPDTTTTVLYVKIGTGPVQAIAARSGGSDDPNVVLIYATSVGGQSAASGVSKGLLANRPAATGSGAAYYATDTGQLTVDIAVGQWSSAPGSDLADFIYNPGGGATYTTTSATFAAIDATNLAFTFTAPDSGIVWVDLTCSISNPANAPVLGLLEGAATVVSYGVGQNMADIQQRTFRFRVTGLTPGTSHTYKLAWAANSGGTVTIFTNSAVPVMVRVVPGK